MAASAYSAYTLEKSAEGLQQSMPLRASQSWTWVKALAVLGVLLHAGLLVRHAVHATQSAASIFAIVICKGDATGLVNARLPQPDDPLGPQHAPCPACTAAADNTAILPPVGGATRHIQLAQTPERNRPSASVVRRAEVPPPGRGPPNAAT
jgi:hypothetical protein